jgi:hypothetical protein
MTERLDEPSWRAGDPWEELPQWGNLLAKRYAAGLPPMRNWKWHRSDNLDDWVGLAFAGDRWEAPIGAAVYLRPADGAVVCIGSGSTTLGIDFASVIADLPSDAPAALIDAEIERRHKAEQDRIDYFNSPDECGAPEGGASN